MSNSSKAIEIVGRSIKVVEHDGLTIEECIGNVATKNDDLSLALVTITRPTSEPWLTLHYDEYIHVTEGYIEMHQEDGVTTVKSGETIFIPRGARMRPVFPAPAKYVPVCVPAFKPERCVREEGGVASDVSVRLNELHLGNGSKVGAAKEALSAEELNARFDNVETIYHMCQKSAFESAKSSGSAYYPPTFHQDGRFTHATAIPANLISTANHFYTSTEGEWICLELSRAKLEKLGIVTVFESAKPVGDVDTDKNWKDAVFPHIFGGIPVHLDGVVKKIYSMKRGDNGTFLSIDGLVS